MRHRQLAVGAERAVSPAATSSAPSASCVGNPDAATTSNTAVVGEPGRSCCRARRARGQGLAGRTAGPGGEPEAVVREAIRHDGATVSWGAPHRAPAPVGRRGAQPADRARIAGAVARKAKINAKLAILGRNTHSIAYDLKPETQYLVYSLLTDQGQSAHINPSLRKATTRTSQLLARAPQQQQQPVSVVRSFGSLGHKSRE
ncbi:MAG: hypothetical protein MZV64_13870 [Ignavibacteriales bacterium]|nr:hypothetical protein [Ignavibacteriales bacterium]